MKNFFKGNINRPFGKRGYLMGAFLNKKHPLYSKKFEVALMKVDKKTIDSKHYHKKMNEFIIVLSGGIDQEVNSQLIKLRKNDFIYQPAGCITELKNAFNNTKLLIIKAPSIPTDKYLL